MAKRYNEIERLKSFYDLTGDVTTRLVGNLLGNTTKNVVNGMRTTKTGQRRIIRLLLISATAAMLGWAGLASAQTVERQEAGKSEAGTIDEVIVTARRREESQQSTPVSVTVFSAQDIRDINAHDLQDLRGTVPNLELQPLSTGATAIIIRGIGQTQTRVNVDPKAGLYIDDVYISRQEGNFLAFYDVDSLQVLKGPQGTLFGKNTTAGALLLTTVRPGEEYGGYLNTRVGSYNRLDLEGAVNIPLNDWINTRFSFRTQNTDGFVTHFLDDGKSNNINDKSGRFQINLQPSDIFTIDLLVEHNQMNTDGGSKIRIDCRDNALAVRNYNSVHIETYCTKYPLLDTDLQVYGGAVAAAPMSCIFTEVTVGGDYDPNTISCRYPGQAPFQDVEVNTINLRMAWDLTDNLSLRSTTAFRDISSRGFVPAVNLPVPIYSEFIDTTTDQWSQELSLHGSAVDGRLNYVTGLFWSRQDTALLQDTGPDYYDPVGYIYDATNDYSGSAIYAQASYKVTEAMELTVGGRYTRDEKDAVSSVFFQQVYVDPCVGFRSTFEQGSAVCGGEVTGASTASWTDFSPRIQLSYQFNPEFFTYASATKGYNAGGFNQQLRLQRPDGDIAPYVPEDLWSYEVGVRSDWLGNRVRVNLSVFYQDYKNIQANVRVPFMGTTIRQVISAAEARQQGIEGEIEFWPTSNLSISANFASLDQKYTKILPPAVGQITLETPIASAPKETYSLVGSYTHELAGGNQVRTLLNWRYVGSKPSCSPLGSCDISSYDILGGRVDFTNPDSSWSLSLWANNLTDKRYAVTKSVGLGSGTDQITPGRPREVGLELGLEF